jgi:hypothetical protein
MSPGGGRSGGSMTERLVRRFSLAKAEPELWVISAGPYAWPYPRRRRTGRKSATLDLEARVTEGLRVSGTDYALEDRAGNLAENRT